MSGYLSAAGLALGIGALLIGGLGFPPLLMIAVLAVIIALLTDEEDS